MKKIRIKSTSGFTLIELLVVVAIIGLISSIAIVTLNNVRAEARDAKRLADMDSIQNALELYYHDYGVYPNPECYGLPGIVLCTSILAPSNWISDLMPDYIKQIPNDPVNTGGTDPLSYFYTRLPGSIEDRQQYYYLMTKLESQDQIDPCDPPWNGWTVKCGGNY
jgi:type II secretion system protein G